MDERKLRENWTCLIRHIQRWTECSSSYDSLLFIVIISPLMLDWCHMQCLFDHHYVPMATTVQCLKTLFMRISKVSSTWEPKNLEIVKSGRGATDILPYERILLQCLSLFFRFPDSRQSPLFGSQI